MERIVKKNMSNKKILDIVRGLKEGDTVIVSKNCTREQIDLILDNLPKGVYAYQPTSSGRVPLGQVILDDSASHAREMGVDEEKILKSKEEIDAYMAAGPGTTDGKLAFEANEETIVTGEVIDKKEEQNKNEEEMDMNEKQRMEKVREFIFTAKEEMENVVAKTMKPIGFAIAVKRGWDYLKEKVFRPVRDYFRKEKGTMAFAAGAGVVGGAVTSSAVGALHVGLAICAIYYLIKLLRKKIDSNEFIVKLATVFAVSILLPFVLYAAFMGSVALSTVLFAVPYLVIVG